jgi:hypothetical protein
VKNGDALTIDVPPLSARDDTAAVPPGVAPETSGGLRTLAFVLGGVGVAGLAVGSVTGLLAFSAHDDAVSKCAHYPDRCPADGSGTSANDRAQTLATVSTIGFVAGGALLAGGACLFFIAPPSRSSALRVAPSFGLNGSAALAVDGSF